MAVNPVSGVGGTWDDCILKILSKFYYDENSLRFFGSIVCRRSFSFKPIPFLLSEFGIASGDVCNGIDFIWTERGDGIVILPIRIVGSNLKFSRGNPDATKALILTWYTPGFTADDGWRLHWPVESATAEATGLEFSGFVDADARYNRTSAPGAYIPDHVACVSVVIRLLRFQLPFWTVTDWASRIEGFTGWSPVWNAGKALK